MPESNQHSTFEDDVVQMAENLMWRWVEEGHEYQGSTEACQILADYAHRLFEQLEVAQEEILFLCSDEDDIRKGLREQVNALAAALREIMVELPPERLDEAPQVARRALEVSSVSSSAAADDRPGRDPRVRSVAAADASTSEDFAPSTWERIRAYAGKRDPWEDDDPLAQEDKQ